MFKVNFMANQTVTAEDINAIGYNLANTVYTTFADDTTYGVDELNAITSHIMNRGVIVGKGTECSVNISGDMVHISDGVAFFECGAVMTVDSDGIDINVENNADKQCVYLFFDSDVNVAGARCTVAEPTGDFVMLATIENGTVTMDRTYATLKSDVYGANEVKTVTLNSSTIEKESGTKIPDTYMRFETDFVVTSYKGVRIYAKTSSDYNGVYIDYDIQNRRPDIMAMRKGTGSNLDWISSYYGYPGYYMTYYENNTKVSFDIVDGKLVIDVLESNESPYYVSGMKNSISCEFYGGAEV